MDPDLPSEGKRKVKYPPKKPPHRAPKPVATASEPVAEDDGDEETQRILDRRAREHLAGRGRRAEKKPSEVAFTHGVASNSVRTFGKQRERAGNGIDGAKYEESIFDDTQSPDASISPSASDEEDLDGPSVKKNKEYREPWDYESSNYPIVLPQRPPNSGDPELLDKEEFENPVEYNENTLCSALELGLLDEDGAPRMLFFQFPCNLPFVKSQERSMNSKGKEIATNVPKVPGNSTDTTCGKKAPGGSMNRVTGQLSAKGSHLEELPEGYMGKMLVYKSGNVKLKFGDILYDVSSGIPCSCPERVVAINSNSGHLCELGELTGHAVVSPDIDCLVDLA